MTNASKSALLLSTFLIGINVPMAHAQVLDDTDTRAVDLREQELLQELVDADGIDQIVVTGSRVRRQDLDTAFPTLVVGDELLEKNAFTNVIDALAQIPAFGGGTGTISGAGDQGDNIGAEFANFLGLGSQRTLTLVNGRRFVSSNAANGGGATGLQADFSVFPIGLVERIETIGVGGAPTYGSDAIAGTINVILKDDFEGLESRVQFGESERGDLDTQQYSVLIGANSDNGRGNVTFNVEYTDNEGLLQAERPDIYVNEPFTSLVGQGTDGFNDISLPSSLPGSIDPDANFDSDGDGIVDRVRRVFNVDGNGGGQNVQLFTPGGVVSAGTVVLPSLGAGLGADGQLYAFDRSGNLVGLAPGSAIPGTSAFFAQGGFANDFFSEVDQIRSPVKRINFGSTFKYDLAEWITFKGDAQFSNSKATELAEQGGFQTFAFGGTSGALRIPTTNPFLSGQARGVLTDQFGIGSDGEFVLSRFNNDLLGAGAREGETSLWRFAGGFVGDFNVGDRNFYYDISGVAGESNIETQTSLLNNRRFLNAIDAVVDPATGQIVCRVTLDGAPDLSGNGVSETSSDVTSCAPLNLFGEGVQSPEALEYVTQRGISTTDIEQQVFTANLGGEIFELPAGWIQAVVGYEARNDSALFATGGAVEVGLGRGAAVLDSGGKTSTNEYFGEVFVPIVSADMGIPFVERLEAGGQVREVNNSAAGSFTSWTVEGTYQPVEDLSIRGNVTRSFRAPSLIELFQPVTTAFDFADDPCDDRFINDGPNRSANCAAVGISGPFTSNIVNATVEGLTGGNPNLTNEIAESFTIGAVLQPRWVSGLTVQVDYINIDLQDRIGTQSVENNLETCFDADPGSFPNVACSTFTRGPDGQITGFQSGQLNADIAENQFLNIRADYGFDVSDAFNLFGGNTVGDYGTFGINTSAFHVIQRDLVLAGVPADNTVGNFADPEWSGIIDGTWTKDGLRLFWRAIWQDNSLLSPSGENLVANADDELIYDLGWNWVHNASIAYDVSENFANYDKPLVLQLNVNNVFDDDPGRGIRRAFGDFYQSEIFGRTYSIALRASF